MFLASVSPVDDLDSRGAQHVPRTGDLSASFSPLWLLCSVLSLRTSQAWKISGLDAHPTTESLANVPAVKSIDILPSGHFT